MSDNIFTKHHIFIIWKDEYNLGVPIIDEQHKGVTTIINSLHFGIQNNYAENIIKSVVDMMYHYAIIHFKMEEEFMDAFNFPDAKEHKKSHEELTAKLGNLGTTSIINKDSRQLMGFLKEWWIGHICKEDLQLKKYLEK